MSATDVSRIGMSVVGRTTLDRGRETARPGSKAGRTFSVLCRLIAHSTELHPRISDLTNCFVLMSWFVIWVTRETRDLGARFS